MVATARSKGLTVPVVLTGYNDPFMTFGIKNLAKSCISAGISGFSIVDLPANKERSVIDSSASAGLSFNPMVTPTTTNDRIKSLGLSTGSYLQCAWLTEDSGVRMNNLLGSDLKEFTERVQANSKLPVVACFGIQNPTQVAELSQLVEGVVVGSAIIEMIDSNRDKKASKRQESVTSFIRTLSTALVVKSAVATSTKKGQISSSILTNPAAPHLQIKEILASWRRNPSATIVNRFMSARFQECTVSQIGQLMSLLGEKSNTKSHVHLKRCDPRGRRGEV